MLTGVRLPSGLADHLSSLFEHVLGQLHPIICRLASGDVTERERLLNYSSTLLLWSRAIAFGRYLDHPSMIYLQC
jgi:hypothetical protein